MGQRNSTVILARVSSKSQEDEGYSLDAQLKLLHSYCLSKQLSVERVFKIAETASKEQGRKIFHEMLEYIRREKIYHLAVEKTDRLTRNFKDAVAVDDWLERDEHRQLHAVKESLLLHKNAKSDVKFMWNIHLAVAKKYTDNLREEAMKGWAEKLAQGWLPAPPPPGYVTVTEGGKRIHVPDAQTSALMRKLLEKYLEPGESIRSITVLMEAWGIRTRPGRPYVKSQVEQILKNPFYIGVNRFDGQDYPGAQTPLISKELFDSIQFKLHKGRPPRQRKHNPVLKGMMVCVGCNGVVTWELQKGRYYGKCQKCKGRKFARQDRVEEEIVKQLERLVCPSEQVIQWVAESMRSRRKDTIDQREKLLASISTQIDRLKRMDGELYDDKLAGEISRDRYTAKHDIFTAQIKDLEDQLLRANRPTERLLEERLVIFELSQRAAELYARKTPEQKRIIIKHLFKQITSGDGGIKVNYTSFVSAIAHKVRLTRELTKGGV
jgi:DNA invertase Pin-like site-specific DNA recombinase